MLQLLDDSTNILPRPLYMLPIFSQGHFICNWTAERWSFITTHSYIVSRDCAYLQDCSLKARPDFLCRTDGQCFPSCLRGRCRDRSPAYNIAKTKTQFIKLSPNHKNPTDQALDLLTVTQPRSSQRIFNFDFPTNENEWRRWIYVTTFQKVHNHLNTTL